jgi:hypothetical protein
MAFEEPVPGELFKSIANPNNPNARALLGLVGENPGRTSRITGMLNNQPSNTTTPVVKTSQLMRNVIYGQVGRGEAREDVVGSGVDMGVG